MAGRIAVIGALDTKGDEFMFVKKEIEKRGHTALVINVGIVDDPGFEPEVAADKVARAAGSSLAILRDKSDRGLAIETMTRGIGQVITNLVANAVAYSHEGTQISLEATRNEHHVIVSVTDQGIGIPQEEQERIFERFYRVDNDITRQVRGAGLGLSICKWIVEAHGGQISVDSTPQSGSTFCVTLPTSSSVKRQRRWRG